MSSTSQNPQTLSEFHPDYFVSKLTICIMFAFVDSRASFSLPSRLEDGVYQWPPTSFPFITAVRPSCVLCEGPLNRKTVGRLIPPGLDNSGSGSGLMASSTFSDDSRCVSPQPNIAQPQQRYPRSASWKPYWTALVVMEGWSSAFMVYFDAITKKPKCREDVRSFILLYRRSTPDNILSTSFFTLVLNE